MSLSRFVALSALALAACSGPTICSSDACLDSGTTYYPPGNHADSGWSGGDAGATSPGNDAGNVANDAGNMTPSDGGNVTPDSGTVAVANGTVAAWQALSAMPHPRANHCSVTVGNRLYVLGGNYLDANASSFVTLASVDMASALPDGTLGAWAQAGTLPSGMTQCTAAADEDNIYVVDAIYDDDATWGGQVLTAPVNSADGTLGSWNNLGPLPSGLRVLSERAWVAHRTLFAMDANIDGDGGESTLVLELDLANPGAGWTQQTMTSSFRGWAQYAWNGTDVYQLGGYTSGANSVTTDDSAAPLAAAGALGTTFSTTAIPEPTAAGDAMAVDGFVFLVGGKSSLFGSSGVPDVYSAPVQADGTLGAWTSQSGLPEGRTHECVTLVGSYLYVTGGGFGGPGLNTVFGAQVRF